MRFWSSNRQKHSAAYCLLFRLFIRPQTDGTPFCVSCALGLAPHLVTSSSPLCTLLKCPRRIFCESQRVVVIRENYVAACCAHIYVEAVKHQIQLLWFTHRHRLENGAIQQLRFETTTVAISFETRRRAPNPLEKHIRLVSSLLFCCCVCFVPAMSQYDGRKDSASSTDGYQENVWGSPSGHICITKFRVGRDSYKWIFPNVEETLGKLDSGSRHTLQNLSGNLVQVPDN